MNYDHSYLFLSRMCLHEGKTKKNPENKRSVITRIDKSKMFCLRGTILKNHVFWSTVFGDVEIRTKQTLFC